MARNPHRPPEASHHGASSLEHPHRLASALRPPRGGQVHRVSLADAPSRGRDGRVPVDRGFRRGDPRFLGHLTEEGRVIGFVLEYISNAGAAGPGDLAACQSVLQKLHSLGVKHGDINKHNFLVRDDGRVVLLDFETATKDVSRDELEAEYQRLTESLQDPSLRRAVRPAAAALSDPMRL
ncbi:hypothetical protein B0T18DRAFT_452276 [Schizothecium vesticola]|uniref:Protein kinase domain-containing protein n=1 Tax=Schizothecium vesticola TaxID=314040 RepID=A0AA40KC19_9PEZI|nr:hypothetical protein B0T18DRAFT_452276 [Schizothecium vesticola]